MSEHPESEQQSEAVAVALPGHRLKTTREDLHLSREEVAHHLHLDSQIVKALEDDNFEVLPSPAYICGYLRSYARLLKLPEVEIVNAYSKGKEINAALIPENISIIPDKKTNPAVIKTLFIVIIATLLIATFLWFANEIGVFKAKGSSGSVSTIEVPVTSPAEQTLPPQSATEIQRPAQIQQQIEQFNEQIATSDSAQGAEKPDPISEDPSPLLISEYESVPVAETNNVSSDNGDLRLVFNEDSWTEVTDADSHRHVYRLVKAGSEFYVNGVAPYVILLGNADGVKVFYNGVEFDHHRFQRDQIAYFRLGIKQE